MDKEKLLQEHRAVLESLIEKTKFIYSEEFYALDEFEKQKFIKDKAATEAHINTLNAVLWAKTPQINGLADLFGLAIISSMFGNFGSNSFPTPPLPNLAVEDAKEEPEDKPE